MTAGTGTPALATCRFATETARYVRITQTESSPSWWWSIAEFNVYGG